MLDTTCKLMLDTRKNCQKEDGSYPLKVRLRFKGKNIPISIGSQYSIEKKFWNDKKNEIRSSLKNSGRVKAKCDWYLKRAEKVVELYEYHLDSLAPKELADLIRNEFINPQLDVNSSEANINPSKVIVNEKSLKEWTRILADRKRGLGKFPTAEKYESDVRVFLKYYGSDQLPISRVNKSFLEDFKVYYRRRNPKNGNGVESKLRTLRKILNDAVDEGELLAEQNPFNRNVTGRKAFKIPAVKPKKRSIDPKVFLDFIRLYHGEKIGEVKLEKGTADYHVVAELVFMWECMAMNFVDLVKLKVRDLDQTVISYNRSKTSGEVELIHTELSLQIFKEYSDGKEPDDYVFRYGFKETESGRHTYKTQLRRWNERATNIARRMGYEDVRVTTYILRHTYATTLSENDVSKDDIGKMFGHSDGRSIHVYIGKANAQRLRSQAKTAMEKLRKSQ